MPMPMSNQNEKQVRKIVTSRLRGFKFYVAASFAFALAIQLLALAPPLLMRNIIDRHIPEGNMRGAVLAIAFFVALPITSTLLITLYNYVITVVSRNMGAVLIIHAFRQLLHQPTAYFDQNNSAEVAAYCKSEAMNYVSFWLMDIPRLVAGLLGGVVVHVLIFAESPVIAAGLLLYVPVSILPSRYLARKMESYVKKVVENNAKMSQIITGTFAGIKFVKTMMLEKAQIAKLSATNQETVKVWSKTVAIDNLNGNWTDNLVDNIFIGVVFTVSAIFVINSTATLGMLILLLGYMPLFFQAIKAAANANFRFRQQLAQYDKFFEILTMPSEQNNGGEDFAFNDKIIFENVTFAYDQERGNVLNGLNLELQKGKWIGIVGQSGTGKTTVFDLLLKLYSGYNGRITIDGREIAGICTHSLRQHVTKVSQDLFLFPSTLKENLLLIKPDATYEEIRTAINMAGLTDFVQNLPNGLDTQVGEGGLLLSGGEKQRICLAMGLLRGSKILLLDEVTASVDGATEELIKENVQQLMQENDLTVVSISHRLQFLDKADYVVNTLHKSRCLN